MNVAETQTVDDKLHDEAGRLAALKQYEILDTEPELAFDRITSIVKTIFNVPICTVSLIDENRQWLKSCVGRLATETPREISFCTHTIQHREPMYVPDATVDERFRDNPLVTGEPGIRSYLGVPLTTPDGYNVGSLCAIDVVPTSYNPSQIAILKSLAALVVDQFELRRIAQSDYLTGAATRRSFTLELEKSLARFRRSPRPTALLYLDIDHFKKVNDSYGHLAGDEVLKVVSKALTQRLRQSDSFGRMGGEEFAILLDNTTRYQALEAAESLRAEVESLSISLPAPATGAIHVTASFGIAVVSAESHGVSEWMAAADRALYAAKHSGRNRVEVADSI